MSSKCFTRPQSTPVVDPRTSCIEICDKLRRHSSCARHLARRGLRTLRQGADRLTEKRDPACALRLRISRTCIFRDHMRITPSTCVRDLFPLKGQQTSGAAGRWIGRRFDVSHVYREIRIANPPGTNGAKVNNKTKWWEATERRKGTRGCYHNARQVRPAGRFTRCLLLLPTSRVLRQPTLRLSSSSIRPQKRLFRTLAV